MRTNPTPNRRSPQVPVTLTAADWKAILLMAELHFLRALQINLKALTRHVKKPTRRLPKDLRLFLDSLLALRAFKTALHKAGVTGDRDTHHLDDLLIMLTSHYESPS